MFNMFVAGIALAVFVYMMLSSFSHERGFIFAGFMLSFVFSTNLVIGIVKVATEGERDYAKEAKALIEECEAKLPRDQNCIVEMKAVAR